ncbi:hypothetical protein PLESTM_001508100 [Pleodorina starrii]|nr:hypothetical protein PLESTM_001508100 [Pleodorina starrii]
MCAASGLNPAPVMRSALQLVQGFVRAVEADAVRRADQTQRTPLDVVVAVLALISATALVLGCIAFGWWVLWRTTLHKIGVFRDLMGLNRVAKANAKRRAEAEIRALKNQLSQQHGFGQPQAAGYSYGKED